MKILFNQKSNVPILDGINKKILHVVRMPPRGVSSIERIFVHKDYIPFER